MKIHLLGAPMDLGSGRRGVDMGPSAIRIAGIEEALRDLGLEVIDEGDVSIRNMEEVSPGDSQARYLDEIGRASREISDRVESIMAGEGFPLVLGGDHSIAIGTLAGVAAHCRSEGKRLGVLWIDAHGDMNTPATSPSGNIHGMPLASVLGDGPDELARVNGMETGVAPENVVLIGIRSLDDGEKERLRSTGVHVHTMKEIDRNNIHSVMEHALEQVTESTDYVHVSFDLDAIDPLIAPGVGTPVRGGLGYREAHFLMELLADSGVMTSLELVEVNPILDDRNRSAALAVELVQSAFGKRIL